MFRRHSSESDHAPEPAVSVVTVTDATFDAFTAGGFSVIDFFAPWCAPCRQLAPVFDRAAGEHPELSFGRLDVDDNQRTAAQLGVMSIPTVIVFDPSGREVDRLVGAAGIRQFDAFLSSASSSPA